MKAANKGQIGLYSKDQQFRGKIKCNILNNYVKLHHGEQQNLTCDLCLCFTAVPEGFSVDIEPSENPLEQDRVSLRCSADNYTYEHLRWYRLDPLALQEEQDKYTHTAGLDCKSVHQYARALHGRLSFLEPSNSWMLDFSVPAVRPQDEGHYVCEAQSRRSGEKQCLFQYVSVRGER